MLDSTIIGGRDRYLESAAGRLLRDEAAAGRVRIAVPEVVVIEAEANHRRAVQAARERLVAAHEALRDLPSAQGSDLRPWPLRYREDLDRVLREVGGEMLPLPDVPHVRLLERAAAHRRPFDRDGHGYRPALVWESLLALLEHVPEPVILVSEDHRSFSRARYVAELALELEAELADRGEVGRVSLCLGLGQLVAELPRVRELASRWRHSIAQDSGLRGGLTRKLLDVAHAEAGHVLSADLPVAKVRHPRFLAFTKPRDLRVEEAWVSPAGSSLLGVSLTVDYTLAFEILMPSGPSREAHPEWTTVRSSSTIALSFEVIQHDSADGPSEFGARLVGWSDPREARLDEQRQPAAS